MLGVAPAINTRKNPIDFTSRKTMIDELYGHRISAIIPLHDMNSDKDWAKQVDTKIREVFPLGSVTLYGSRDSFIPYYTPYGKFSTCELEPESIVSASQIRDEIKNKNFGSKDFRAGMIYAANSSYPFNFSTVDVAILDHNNRILLGRKENETKYRFIGGFTDLADSSLEQTVRRESYEETNLEIGDIEYVCSMNIDDWRYKGEVDRSIMTTLFKTKKVFGKEVPKDDIAELKWFDLDNFNKEYLIELHQPLFEKLIKTI